MELFDDRVVLFESDEGGEYLLVTCEPSGMAAWWFGRRVRVR